MPDLSLLLPQMLEGRFLLKALFLIVLLLYAIFTFVVLNQVRVMNNVVQETHSSVILEVIAGINLLAAISLFVYAIAIL